MRKVAHFISILIAAGTLAACKPEPERDPTDPGVEKPQPLAETVWKLRKLGPPSATGEFTDVPLESHVGFVIFKNDGQTLQGFAGCQQLEGTYDALGERLTIKTLVITGTRCHKERFDKIGDRFVDVLRNTTSVRLGTDDARLELMTGSTVGAVLFQRTLRPWSW